MDFGELKNDKNFVDKITQLSAYISEIDELVTKCIEFPYDHLDTEQQVKYDLFLAYSMNSLYYMYIKLQGLDPNSHGIKNEISRVREAMLREKQYHDRKLRPTVNKDVASRFIKHGINYKKNKKHDDDSDDGQDGNKANENDENQNEEQDNDEVQEEGDNEEMEEAEDDKMEEEQIEENDSGGEAIKNENKSESYDSDDEMSSERSHNDNVLKSDQKMKIEKNDNQNTSSTEDSSDSDIAEIPPPTKKTKLNEAIVIDSSCSSDSDD